MKRIGIDLGGTKIEGVVLDGNEVRVTERVATPRDDYPGTIVAIVDLIERLEASVGATDLPVGIGTPGAWVPERRAMKNCNSTWLNGSPLKLDLEAALGRSIGLENDANCFALSEAAALGIDRGVVFGVILGTGVGGGLVIDGKLVPGANSIGGEWGHTPLPYFRSDPTTGSAESVFPDRVCYCGRSNCVELFLSGPGLSETHRVLTGDTLASTEIAAESATFDLYVVMLARSLAQLINVIDPDVIVLGGGLSNVQRLSRDVRPLIQRYAFTFEGRTKIVAARMGDSSGVLGAARLDPVETDLS